MKITITGTNRYLMRVRLDELTSGFTKKYGEIALERIDGETTQVPQLLDAAQSLPMLAVRKMVVVDNLSKNAPATEAVEQIIDSSSDAADLVFYEPEIDRRTVYFKVLSKQTDLEEYKNLDEAGLARWLASEASKQGGNLSSTDARFLVERVGNNQALLASELYKLITYQPKISREQIELLVPPTPQSKIFELLDAAFGGNKSRTLKLYDEQRAQKVEPQYILAMIVWQLWLVALAAQAGDRPSSRIAKDAGVGTYPVDKAKRLAAGLNKSHLKDLVERTYLLDVTSKTRSIDLDEALKTYLVTL